MDKLEGKTYNESQWVRCWIANYNDGGWIVGEVEYQSGLHYIINSDNNGELVVPSGLVGWL